MSKPHQVKTSSSNQSLKKKWDDKRYADHRNSVRDARSTIDTSPPQEFRHLHIKLKKLQLEEERASSIERDNQRLIQKMSHIMQYGGRIDNHNDYKSKSLHEEKRRKELSRVSKDNALLVKRIMGYKLNTKGDNPINNESVASAYTDTLVKYNNHSSHLKQRSEENLNEKSMEKRSRSVPKDKKKTIKNLAATDASKITKAETDNTKQ